MRGGKVLTGTTSVLITEWQTPEDLERRPQDELLGGIERRRAL